MKTSHCLPVLLLALAGASCATMDDSIEAGHFTITVRNEFAVRLLTPVIRYPSGSVLSGIAAVPPGAEAGFIGVRQSLPSHATLTWEEADGTIVQVVVSVASKIGRKNPGGEIVFTVKPDRNVVVSYRDFQ